MFGPFKFLHCQLKISPNSLHCGNQQTNIFKSQNTKALQGQCSLLRGKWGSSEVGINICRQQVPNYWYKGDIPCQLLFKAQTCHNLPRWHPYSTQPISGWPSLFGAELLAAQDYCRERGVSGNFPVLHFRSPDCQNCRDEERKNVGFSSYSSGF